MFHKIENGARVGDIFMSLIHTAELCETNPFDYLVALQRNADAVPKPVAGFPDAPLRPRSGKRVAAPWRPENER